MDGVLSAACVTATAHGCGRGGATAAVILMGGPEAPVIGSEAGDRERGGAGNRRACRVLDRRQSGVERTAAESNEKALEAAGEGLKDVFNDKTQRCCGGGQAAR